MPVPSIIGFVATHVPRQGTSITSANSVFTITVPKLFPAPVQLEGYSADRAWSTADLALAEVVMCVDGTMLSGFTPNPVKMSISLQADSPSKGIFIAIQNATVASQSTYYISGQIHLPSTDEVFTCTRGVLESVKPLPDAGKVLQPMEFSIVWQSIVPGSV